MTREEKLKRLADQYSTEFAGNNYPSEFKPQGTMTECNFGGKLIILSDSGDSCIIWSDWADEAVSDKLMEYEIVYRQDPNFPDMEDETTSGFVSDLGGPNETFYPFYNFMKI